MNSSGSLSYLKTFSHIYIEEQAAAYSAAVRIQNRYPDAVRVPIRHYKDMFNRPRQDYSLQKQSPKLILAVKKGRLVYPGAPVCQDFGSRHFYYTSSVMNCLYDCEYCYLQGMYPSANLVVFVNLEDIFREVEQLLEQHPVYLSVSYDTDLLALEQLTGYLDQWCRFTAAHPGLTIEVRTKAANVRTIRQLPPCERVIFAWTLSPETIIRRFEHHTPSLSARLKGLGLGLKGRVRLDSIFIIARLHPISLDHGPLEAIPLHPLNRAFVLSGLKILFPSGGTANLFLYRHLSLQARGLFHEVKAVHIVTRDLDGQDIVALNHIQRKLVHPEMPSVCPCRTIGDKFAV